VVILQGEVWWAELPDPVGSGSGFSNLKWALAPGNLRLTAHQTGLPKESVANVSQIVALDKLLLTKRVGNSRKQSSSAAVGNQSGSRQVNLIFVGVSSHALQTFVTKCAKICT
jgi:mRNA-degrading endonuclease toxin of MazEF toxin-antitoxin module